MADNSTCGGSPAPLRLFVDCTFSSQEIAADALLFCLSKPVVIQSDSTGIKITCSTEQDTGALFKALSDALIAARQ